MAVKFYKSENQVPLEMHKVRVVQKLNLLPVEKRLQAIQEAETIHSFFKTRTYTWTCSPTAV